MVRRMALAIAVSTGALTTASAQFLPGDLCVNAGGTIYKVDATTWTTSVFADWNDGLNSPVSPEFSSYGTLLSSNFGTNEILEFDSSGNGSILYDSSDGISGPYGLVFDSVGNLIVSQPFSDQVLSIPSNGGAATVLADSGDGLLRPLFLGLNTNGDLLVADDLASTVFSIDPGGVVTVFDVLPETPGAIAVRSNGDIYLVTVTSCINLYRYPAGDASQRTLFATFSSLTTAAQLVFSLDGSSLYLTSYDQGGLIEIDPDTASTTQRIKQGMKLNHARGITVFGMYLHPSWSNYGSGVPGTKGVPALTSQGDPFLGSTVTVDLENSYGQPTIGLLFVGFQQADLPSGLGGHLLVAPAFTLPISFSYGNDQFSGALPNDPRLAGSKLEMQAVEADPGAALGVSFTQGLELVLGY